MTQVPPPRPPLLTNLAANAIAYTPAQGTVTVSAAGDSLGWSISVEDNGPGLPAAERDALGQRYRRGSQATAGGSGLGLAICQAIVQAHGGSIAGELSPLGGLRISVVVPLSVQSDASV